MICTLLRKPLTGTVAQTLMEFGGGVMNTNLCRIPPGRYPPNVINTPLVVSEFPLVGRSVGGCGGGTPKFKNQGGGDGWKSARVTNPNGFGYGDTGTAAKFFKAVTL